MVETNEMVDRSNQVRDGDQVIVVVDPRRDADRFEEWLSAPGPTYAFVFETHLLNDYVSGAPELCKPTRSTRCVP
ncbi:MAG TPA: hypothetical protein VNG12_04605 [Acidimicrobiales bacterium]|nr:hypothetical protein [Acidimicrobiales bacterium]